MNGITLTPEEIRSALRGQLKSICRPIDPQPELWQMKSGPHWAGKMPDGSFHDVECDALNRYRSTCPVGVVGDTLRVLEPWNKEGGHISYLADGDWISEFREEAPIDWEKRAEVGLEPRWQAADTMPEWASRLAITVRRVEVDRDAADTWVWELFVDAKDVSNG